VSETSWGTGSKTVKKRGPVGEKSQEDRIQQYHVVG